MVEKIIEVTTIGRGNRTTVPRQVMATLKVKKGDRVVWIAIDGRVEVRKAG